jgi:hypothetical protein
MTSGGFCRKEALSAAGVVKAGRSRKIIFVRLRRKKRCEGRGNEQAAGRVSMAVESWTLSSMLLDEYRLGEFKSREKTTK